VTELQDQGPMTSAPMVVLRVACESESRDVRADDATETGTAKISSCRGCLAKFLIRRVTFDVVAI